EFHTPESGIARGCALSPLMGALHLHAMDAWFATQMEQAKKNNRPGIYYARYMDDVVILAHTRWQLRRQVRALNQFFTEAGFCQHPDKTFIGRTARGYDWMGAQMSDTGVEGIAHRARTNHLERLRRLYERVRKWPAARRQARMSQYRKRWKIWAVSLLSATAITHPARASIGTLQNLDDGIRACLAMPATYNRNGGIDAGTTCSINLSAQSNSPANGGTPGSYAWVAGNYAYLGLHLQPGSSFSQATLSNMKNNLTIACTGGSITYPLSGATITVGKLIAPSPIAYPAGCSYRDNGPLTYPKDVTATGNGTTSGTTAQFNVTLSGTLTLTWNAITPGTKIKYPSLNLQSGDASQTEYILGIGIGGGGGTDPTPPNPPVAGDPPNCTAISGVTTGPYDFGNGSAGTAVGTMTTDKTVSPHNITLTCTSGANGSVAANATLYVQSNDLKNADNKTLVASATDWLGLRLKLPATAGGNGKVATGQTLGDYIVFNGATATPVWNWSLAAESTHNASVPTYPLTLTPEIYQLQAAPGTQDGQRTFTVTYSAIIQ
ncbi:TPA: reverse transcriptase domain-containing protein, partial [Enterobacter ludwigii]